MTFKTVLMNCAVAAALINAAPLALADQAKMSATTNDGPDAMASNNYLLSANEVIGQDVLNTKGDTIAQIDDVLVTKGAHSVVAVLSVGGFMGINDKLVAVPYDSLQVTKKGITAANLSEQKLEKMAKMDYGDSGDADMSHRRYLARMERVMNKWSDKIGDAYDKSADKAKSGAKAVSKGTSEAWDNTKEKFRELKDASGEAWDDTKASFESALEELNKRWDRATN